jgi:hypothetical protein
LSTKESTDAFKRFLSLNSRQIYAKERKEITVVLPSNYFVKEEELRSEF